MEAQGGGGGGGGERLLGVAARRSFSLKAANRLASGSPGSLTTEGTLECKEDEDGDEESEEDEVASGTSSCSRKRLGIRSPVEFRMACSVCQPCVERSWNESARSCWVATRQRRASSS